MEDSLLKFIAQYVELTDEEAEELLGLDIIKRYKKRTLLLKVGEYSRLSYFVLKGCIARYYLVDGDLKVTAIYTENESIVPAANPSEFYLYTLEDSILTAADNETVDLYIKKFPKLETMCRVMADFLFEPGLHFGVRF